MKHKFTREETLRGSEAGLLKVVKQSKTKAKQHLNEKLDDLGFELVSDYEGSRNNIAIRCLHCGDVKEITPHSIITGGTICKKCLSRKREESRQAEKDLKYLIKQEKKEEKDANHLKKITAPHTCKRCGHIYTVAEYMISIGTRYERNSGYCSRKCRDKAKAERDKKNRKKYKSEGKSYRSKHYTRAKKLGLPVEEGVTLKKLIARDGLTCKICGKPCIYNGDYRSDSYPSIDHIKPIHKGGGHTWDNVQVAHRICNSVKSDRIGTEWGNAQKPGA